METLYRPCIRTNTFLKALRVDYMDCATKGKYGVMNFDYWNRNKNTFYK